MESNNESKPALASFQDDNKTAVPTTSEEDNVLASLGTTRAETSNYESTVLRQATHSLAPPLKVDDDSDSEEAFRFPDFIASTSLLPFSAPNQAKNNRKVVVTLTQKLQTQMKQLLLEASAGTAASNASESLRLMAMKQQMLLSMLGRHSKKESIQELWKQQETIEELYQQWEQQAHSTASNRRGRISMQQRKQIPGASSLAKAQQLTKKQRQSLKKRAWSDWSSDEEDNDNDNRMESATARTVLAEMNYSRRRQNRKINPLSNRKRGATKKKSRALKPNNSMKSTRRSSKKRRKSQPTEAMTIDDNAEDIMSSPRLPRRRNNRTPVKSYAEDESGDVQEDEFETTIEVDGGTEDEVHDDIDNAPIDSTINDNEEDAFKAMLSSEAEKVQNGSESGVGTFTTEAEQNDPDPGPVVVAVNKTESEQEETGVDAAVASAEASSVTTTNVTCPLCQHTWTVADPSLVDEELSRHMGQCRSTGTSSGRRRRRATASRSYKEVDENDDVSLMEEPTIQRPPRGGKRKVSAITKEEEEDFVGDADLTDDEVDDIAIKKESTTNDGDQDDFEFDYDMDEEEDDDDELQLEGEDLIQKPSALDDYRLDDYEDRVDYWRLHGVSEMRDMSKLRAEGETDPGATTFNGGLHIPAWMNNRLFAYQRTGLEWMWALHQQQAGGVMGDEMGLGKTVQVSGFLGAMAASRMLKGVLIIAPATMLSHWLSELAIWAPGLRRVLLHSSGDNSSGGGSVLESSNRSIVNEGAAIFRNLRKWLKEARGERLYEWFEDPDGEGGEQDDDFLCGTGYAVITTYEHVRRNQEQYVNHPWSYVVMDEAQKIRNPHADITLACKRLRTPHRIAMTGTPIQNDLKELWSLFDFVFPGRLGTLPAFEEEFAAPIKRGGYSNASPVQVQLAYRCSLVLRDLIDPYLLRRQKSEIEEVRRMPQKSEHVLFCRLSRRQRSMYEAFLASDLVKRIFKGSSLLFAAVTMLRKICNHPDLVLSDPSDTALEAFLRNGCVPEESILQSEDEEDDDINPFPDANPGDDLAERSGKFEVLSKILPLWKKQGHRVIIFSQWTKMLNIIQQFVVAQGWKFLRLDGKTNVASRQKLVDEFNSNTEYFGMLCTTRVGGVGLNLTGANRLILYDPDWNPQTDAQARERAWRFGQEKQVTVYRLCTAGTIEEKIYQRQIFKTALTNKVLHDPRQKRLFSQKDLHDLLTLKPDNGRARNGGEEVIDTANTVARANKNGDGMHGASGNGDGETLSLKNVLKSKGLAGVFDHNFVDPSSAANKSASVREMEEAAKRIAKEAAAALQSSVAEEDPFSPTWTGAPESRFGGGGGGRTGSDRRGSGPSFGGAATAGVTSSNGASKSSGSLLATLRQRNEAVQSGGGKRRPSLTGSYNGGGR